MKNIFICILIIVLLILTFCSTWHAWLDLIVQIYASTILFSAMSLVHWVACHPICTIYFYFTLFYLIWIKLKNLYTLLRYFILFYFILFFVWGTWLSFLELLCVLVILHTYIFYLNIGLSPFFSLVFYPFS
jgi:hypothetical protein